MSDRIPVDWLGEIRIEDAVQEMERRREALIYGRKTASLLLCEHPPVITLGNSANRADVLASDAVLERLGVRLVRVGRGGQATYHGPGQLMIYPVVSLKRGLVAMLESTGAALAQIALSLGVGGAQFRRDPPGVWVGSQKIAACGVHIRRRVMTHGFALNLSTPADRWSLLVPCGMSAATLASIAELGGETPAVTDVAHRFGSDLAAAVARGAGFALE